MSSIRPGTCADPGRGDAHCTEHPGHRYSCYDAGDDVSWNDGTMADADSVHQCDQKECPDHEPPLTSAHSCRLWVWCPGCDDSHCVTIEGDGAWTWDGHRERPTISPSIKVVGGDTGIICHSFLRAGRWEFLGDSTHELAGQTVDMVPLPLWLARENGK